MWKITSLQRMCFSQVDSDGYQFQMVYNIQYHYSNLSAIPREQGFVNARSGNLVPNKTARGWELLVDFKDGSSNWTKMKDLKQSNTLEFSEYAVAYALTEELALKRWVTYELNKRDCIVAKVKSKYWKTINRFGIRIPNIVWEQCGIDK